MRTDLAATPPGRGTVYNDGQEGPSTMDHLRAFKELTKLWISVTSTLSALSVYVLSREGFGWGILALFAGVLLMACGACALNEYQERGLDARMERTRGRPIPSGRVSPRAALILAIVLVESGFLVLILGTNLTTGLLGLLAVAWYNGLYTPLKRVTAFAVVPGSLIGAIPPAMGWVAGGQPLLDPRCLALSFFFFIWQIPHFWLLLFKYGSDYEQAGFPSLSGLFTRGQLARLTFTWMAATGASSLLLPLFRAVGSYPVAGLLVLCSAWLVWKGASLLRGGEDPRPFRLAFMNINLFALAVMALLALDPAVRFLLR